MEFIEYHNGKPVRFLEYNNRLFIDTDDVSMLLETIVIKDIS